jgi:chorismate mutase
MKNQLDSLRKQVNKIDDLLVDLLGKRMKIAKRIGEQKKKQGLPFFDQVRFNRVLSRQIKKGKRYGLGEKIIKEIYQAIHEEALRVQKLL